jgi:hypothetical protein
MAKIAMSCDERYPDYSFAVVDDSKPEFNFYRYRQVDEDTLARWQRVNDEYIKTQAEIERLYDNKGAV